MDAQKLKRAIESRAIVAPAVPASKRYTALVLKRGEIYEKDGDRWRIDIDRLSIPDEVFLESEHNKKPAGFCKNFRVTDEGLFCDIVSEVSGVDSFQVSPVVEYDEIDSNGYMIQPRITRVSLTYLPVDKNTWDKTVKTHPYFALGTTVN